MKYKQEEIWKKRTQSAVVANIISGYHYPYDFQKEFAAYLNGLGETLFCGQRLKVCEMGCEFGVSSLLLSEKIFERHGLDLNPEPLKLLEQAADELGLEIQVHNRDMFQTNFPDESFDLVFSNGVLEHYELQERKQALEECARITRRGGMVIIGIPNHCSLPYRFAYLLRRLTGRWHYPPEYKIRCFTLELGSLSSLKHQRLMLFDQETIFRMLPRWRISSLPFRFMHVVCKFEPYLRVFEMGRV